MFRTAVVTPGGLLLALVVLLISVPAATAQRPRCPAGQTAYRLEGPTVCVKPSRTPATASATETLVRGLLRDAAWSPKGLRATRLTPAMRRALTRATPRIVGLARTTETAVDARAGAASRAPRQAARVEGGSFTQRSGDATMTATASGRLAADGAATLELGMRFQQGRSSAEFRLEMDFAKETSTRTLCPDADGEVVFESRDGASVTTIVRDGGRVERAETVRIRGTTRTVGRVGPDGRLTSVATTQTGSTQLNRRGLELTISTRGTVSGTRDAPGRTSGTPTVDATVKADGLSPAERRASEREIARQGVERQAQDDRQISDTGRKRLLEAAANWEDESRRACVDIQWSPPDGASVAVGEARGVQGTVVLKKDGSRVPTATWQVLDVSVGAFTGGAGGAFTAVGGKSDDSRTVFASVLAASPAGRVRAVWSARDAAVYDIRIDALVTANLATHDATARMASMISTTKADDALTTRGTKAVDWSAIAFTSKVPECSFADVVTGGEWSVTTTQQPDMSIVVRWTVTPDTVVNATWVCPAFSQPGFPGPRPVAVGPLEFTLPRDGGVQPISGVIAEGGSDFTTTGTITVTPTS